MIRSRTAVFIVLACVAIFAAIKIRNAPSSEPVLVGSANVNPTGPAMVPWREPAKDMARFFPNASEYKLETVVLSRFRPEILRRMEPSYHMDSTAVYSYLILKNGSPVGRVIPRRISGIHGAIEIVVALDNNLTVRKVAIQRSREPENITNWLFADNFLSHYAGKDYQSDFDLTRMLSTTDSDAIKTAKVLSLGVKSIVVELTVALKNIAHKQGRK